MDSLAAFLFPAVVFAAFLLRKDDIIKRLRNALDNVGTYLSRAFKHDEWGTKGELRRLISRVFGARDYDPPSAGGSDEHTD